MSELIYIPVAELYPHPDNPRKVVDDLEELAASIKANGIYQNLTVIKGHYMTMDEWIEIAKKEGVSKENAKATFPEENFVDDGYTVIIGHRRLAAAKLAGLKEVPCSIAEMSEKKQIQTMLLENMQRKDLKVYEEAKGFQMLLDFGETVDEVSEKTGFSATTIRRRVRLNELDQAKLKKACDTRQIALGTFDELAKIEDVEKRNYLLEYIGTDEFKYKFTLALQEQQVDKILPEVNEWIAEIKAKEMSVSQRYGGGYERIGSWSDFDLHDWNETKKKLPKPDKKKIYYYIDKAGGKLELYYKEKKAAAPKPTEEEIEYNRRLENAWAYIENQSITFYRMRQEFIKNFVTTKANETAVLQGAVWACLLRCYDYTYVNRHNVDRLLGTPHAEFTSRENTVNVLKKVKKIDSNILAQLVYEMFGDDEKQLTTNNSWRKAWPTYDANPRLLYLYRWLTSPLIGYTMSETEKSLVYGEAKIYEENTEAPADRAELDAEKHPAAPDGEPTEV